MLMNTITSMAKRPCERPADEHDPNKRWSARSLEIGFLVVRRLGPKLMPSH